MSTQTVMCLDGEYRRINLPNPHWTGKQVIGNGVTLFNLYSGLKTGRKFMDTFSCWQLNNGRGVVGTKYTELDDSEYIRLCDDIGIEPENITTFEV